ncbi:MAG: hypothetical protein NZ518_00770, partial [Dehalococcoidia bacterium]|nr:hypothetical protein [Dehalococcoidia bacterium]
MATTNTSIRLSRRALVGAGVAGAAWAAFGQPGTAAGAPSEATAPGGAIALAQTRTQTAPTHIVDCRIPGQPDAGIVQFCSPTLYDVDNDGKLEIVFGTTARRQFDSGDDFGGRARVFIYKQADRRQAPTLWAWADTPFRADRGETRGGAVQGQIAVGTLFAGDPTPYLLVPIGADIGDTATVSGGVACFRVNAAGTSPTNRLSLAWFFADTLDDLPPADGKPDPVWAAPLIADVDGDGNNEVFFGAWDRNFYLLSADGQRRPWLDWDGVTTSDRFHAKDTIWSSACAADVDGDGRLEVFCGADISANPAPGIETPNGGFIYGFKWSSERNRMERYWRSDALPEAIYSSPLVADIDGDGAVEVVCGSGVYWSRRLGNPNLGAFVVCLDARTGRVKWTFRTNGPGWTAPAIANVLGRTSPSGRPTFQVVAVSSLDPTGPDGVRTNQSSVFLIDSNGAEIWRARPVDASGSNFFLYGSPVIADYNGDGELEIIVANGWSLCVFNRAGAQIDTLTTQYSLLAAPAIADVDGDGNLELFIAGSRFRIDPNPTRTSDRAWLYAFNLRNQNNLRPPVVPWGQFRRTSTGVMIVVQPFVQQAIGLPTGATTRTFTVALSAPDGPTGFVASTVSRSAAGVAPQATPWLTLTPVAQTIS